MWTLWIVSTVIGLEEPRWTRYADYESLNPCYNAVLELESEFTQNEFAVCDYE